MAMRQHVMREYSNHHPFYRIAAGGFYLLLWVAGSIFTVLTDENLLEGGNGAIQLTWEVLKQPWDLITGKYTGIELVAILGAYLIYSVYVYLSIRDAIHPDRTLETIVWGLIVFDGIANFQFFHAYPQMPLIYQCMLTGLIYIALVYLGPNGFKLLMSGIRDLRGSSEE